MHSADDLRVLVLHTHGAVIRVIFEQTAQFVARLLVAFVLGNVFLIGVQEQVEQILVVTPKDFHAREKNTLNF